MDSHEFMQLSIEQQFRTEQSRPLGLWCLQTGPVFLWKSTSIKLYFKSLFEQACKVFRSRYCQFDWGHSPSLSRPFLLS